MSIRTKFAWSVVAVAAVSLLVGGWFVFSAEKKDPLLSVRLKRYGKTSEGLPVAWLTISNLSPNRVFLMGDLNPLPTAFCEYRQELSGQTTNWIYRPVSTSGGMSVKTKDEISVRVLLPTNGVPTRVNLLVSRPNHSRESKIPRKLRTWLYREGLASPTLKIPVPVELLHTNLLPRPR